MRSADLHEHWRDLPTRRVRSLTVGIATDAPDLVVVPGLGALGYLLPLVRACAGWTRVHLLDVPGFGRWSTARLPADLATTADVVSGWLGVATDRPVTLLGHSTGAQVALRAAAAAPDRVARLVLAGATFSPDARRVGPLLAQVARTLPHERPGELPAVLPEYLRGATRLPQLLRSALADRPEDRLDEVPAPLLVLRGRDDALCPEPWARRLAANGALVTVPGAHNFPYTHPGEASRALRVS